MMPSLSAPSMPDISIALSDADVEKVAKRVAELLADQLKPPADPDEPLLVDEGVAARKLGVSRPYLKRLRQQGHVVPSRGKRPVLYSAEDIGQARKYLAGERGVA